jgi:hypothetical protein
MRDIHFLKCEDMRRYDSMTIGPNLTGGVSALFFLDSIRSYDMSR